MIATVPFILYPPYSFVISVLAVMGSAEHSLSSLSIEGSVSTDGESFKGTRGKANYAVADGLNGGPGGGSGGTILLFLHTVALGESAVLSSIGGSGGPNGSGGGGGGRIHFHWSDIPTGDVYQPIATVKGSIHARFVHYSNGTYFCMFL